MTPDVEATRKRLNHLAWLLDSVFVIPGINVRFGVDAIIGLIPGLGDLAGVVLSSYIVREASRLGLPKSVLIRMVVNVAIEGVIGIIPFAGDVFDAAWKANQRNVQLLNQYLDHPTQAARASRTFVFALSVVLIVLIVTLSAAAFLLVRWLWQALS
jgi:hypothetical protein